MRRSRLCGHATMLALILLLAEACGQDGSTDRQARGPTTGPAGSAPVVTDDAGGLVLTYVDDEGHFEVENGVAEVPEKHRGVVRVQDPAHPPTDPEVVWLADLTKKQSGTYAVRLGRRSEFDALARPAGPPAPPAAPDGGGAGATTATASPPVVMYVTSTCPVCRRARSWLARRGVSFVERDVGRDEQAAAELELKAHRQGVRADGVPVFDVRGKLIPGFDERALRRELGI